MNSSIYECRVLHHRLSPKEHRFVYRIFMFGLDLSEIPVLDQKLRWFSRNRWNLYSFYDRDHLQFSSAELLDNVREYLASQGVQTRAERVLFITLPRVLGYIFNPASFYFCFASDGAPLATVVQVGNTFGEMKLYLATNQSSNSSGRFVHRETKYFYVSPFFDHDLDFAFDLQTPGEELVLQIDDYHQSERVLHTLVTGKRRELSDSLLLNLTWKYPLVTLKVILGIHWEAFLLWKKGLPFHRKLDHAHLQKNIHRVNVCPTGKQPPQPKANQVGGNFPSTVN